MDPGAEYYRRFLLGEDEAMVFIIRDYKDGLMLFINRYVKNIHTAQDLTEDTFFLLVTQKPHFTARYAFKTWLYTIGRNLAFTSLKKQRRIGMPLEESGEIADDRASVERAYLKKEQHIELHRALSKLPDTYAAVLHLKYFEQLPNEQIAKILHKTKRQVENLLYQAKKSLKTKLEQEGFVYEEL